MVKKANYVRPPTIRQDANGVVIVNLAGELNDDWIKPLEKVKGEDQIAYEELKKKYEGLDKE